MLTNRYKFSIIKIEYILASYSAGEVIIMTDYFVEREYIKQFIESFDDSFNWYLPDEEECEIAKAQLLSETGGNPRLHIHKYSSSADVLAKRKDKSDYLFLLPSGECAVVHLTFGDKRNGNELHFLFFNDSRAAVQYLDKLFRTDYLGEKSFKFSVKDKVEIFIFMIQIILFFLVPSNYKSVATIITGVILYFTILYDWKKNGFNLFRDKSKYLVNVIPLLRYQIAYISVISVFMVVGIVLSLLSGIITG